MTDATVAGHKILVTAGPTFEDIDPVRYLANRSSGKMGFAIADAAAAAGAEVHLVVGPSDCQQHDNKIKRINVRSALQMLDAVMDNLPDVDVFIACAAVADYRPAALASEKIKKTGERMQLELVRNPDILATVAALPNAPLTVGFAAETCKVEEHARRKLRQKKIHMIAANCVAGGQGFDRSDNRLLLLFADGRQRDLGLQSKTALAQDLISVIGAELHARK
jgi:phosphopantothenoylcysteine decarboxylase/phosphopantothenate--cysteine ligase